MISNLVFPLDYIFLVFGSLVILSCFWRGFIISILSLLTWIGSILITIYFYINLSNFINSHLLKINILKNYEQMTNLASIIISVPILFLISLFILKRLRGFISSDLDKQILGIIFDKTFGFLFGFILNYIIFSTLIYSINNIEILYFLNNFFIENSLIFKLLESYNNNIINFILGNEEVLIN